MTEKQQHALETILSNLPEDCRADYREIADYAVSLGYMPVLQGKQDRYADFAKSKVKKRILKMDTDPKHPPRLALRFFALPSYTGIFHEAILNRIAYWDKLGYAPRCFGCGHCSGAEGYHYALPDGRKGFLCGFGAFTLPTISAKDIPAIKEALRIQDSFYMSQK